MTPAVPRPHRPRRPRRSRRSGRRPAAGALVALALAAGALATPASYAASGPAPTAAPTAAGPGASAAAAVSAAAPAARKPLRFKAASFNILGTQHTVHSSQYASGPRRARMAVRWLADEGTSVLGMSEAQRDQMKVLVGQGGWRSYPRWRTSYDTQTAQSVLWRPERWSKVRARTFVIPFNLDQRREQPMVLLRNNRTGDRLWVVSVHLTYGSSPRARKERRIGIRRMIRNVQDLQRTPHPVLLTGDMNTYDKVFCAVVGQTSLDAPLGGSFTGGRCHPPSGMRIDWIFGSASLGWSDFRFADGRRIDRITDHTVPVVTVTG